MKEKLHPVTSFFFFYTLEENLSFISTQCETALWRGSDFFIYILTMEYIYNLASQPLLRYCLTLQSILILLSTWPPELFQRWK